MVKVVTRVFVKCALCKYGAFCYNATMSNIMILDSVLNEPLKTLK